MKPYLNELRIWGFLGEEEGKGFLDRAASTYRDPKRKECCVLGTKAALSSWTLSKSNLFFLSQL